MRRLVYSDVVEKVVCGRKWIWVGNSCPVGVV